MSMTNFDKNVNIISSLSDEPNSSDGLTADELKAKFDAAVNLIKDYINNTQNVGIDAALALKLNIADVKDSVVEAGWSNGWFYHKWSTGWIEAWCPKLYTGINIGTAWGNIFESNDAYMLPTIGVSFSNSVRYTVECAGSSGPLISVNVVAQLDPSTGNIQFGFSSATMQSGVSAYVVGHVTGY